LTQIELGKRNIDVTEVMSLSVELGFSIDRFLSEDYSNYGFDILNTQLVLEEPDYKERNSIPEFSSTKFKQIFLYILEKCAGKPNVGETVLNKLLYFSDFNYYELYEEHLSGLKYRKLPYGPVPDILDSFIEKMVSEEQISRIKTEYY